MTVAGEPLILSVETAARGGSVCLLHGSEVLALTTGDPNISHSNTLLSDIEQCLGVAKVSLSDIELFAAASGPGSFTGLRIGIATIKALATTLNRPAVGVPTLHAIAHAAGESTATVALMPAGRGELFVQMLSVSAGGDVTELDAAAHLIPERVMERYGSLSNLRWVGAGAQVLKDLIREKATARGIRFTEAPDERSAVSGEPIWFLDPEPQNLATSVATIALRQLQRGTAADPQSLRAIYVRPSDAELKCR